MSFYYAMLEITSSTDDTIRTMEHRVTNLKITNFVGENVSTACSQLRSAITRLTFLDKYLFLKLVLLVRSITFSGSLIYNAKSASLT